MVLNTEEDRVRTVCTRDASQSQKFRFNVGAKSFTQQYAKFYETRLNTFNDNLNEAVQHSWGSDVPIRQICDVVLGERCVLLGTIFKQMPLQPSILKELGEELNIPTQPVMDNFTSDEDVLILEDMLQRIVLIGDIKADNFVTGVCVAVKGREDERKPGYFNVEEVCYPQLRPSPPPACQDDAEVLFVSGLEFGGSKHSPMAAQLLVDFVSGSLGNEEARRICRVIVAGNLVSPEVHDKEQHYKAKYLMKSAVAGTVDAVKDVSSWLNLLTRTVPVTIMPGESDPSNATLPQQPLHPCMFADENECLESSTNPYECDIAGVRILGHSGQPCNNIKMYSKLENSVDIMKRCLDWAHMAPTAPDTMACYPYTDNDPFIIKNCPHLFFAGNQNTLEGDYYSSGDGKHCLCISVPKFSETGLCVRVNLRTLTWEPVLLSGDCE
ncbi:DNA polymerase delta subunit 2-like [Watersipora subatra]|uniref:DNA polymerase delta subunit 2-like n=1 Tax=Watersipora subatra TaxID=2589382 RepID=UPI00355BE984